MNQRTVVAALVEFAELFDNGGYEPEAKMFDTIAQRAAQVDEFGGGAGFNPDEYRADDLFNGADDWDAQQQGQKDMDLDTALSMMSPEQLNQYYTAIQNQNAPHGHTFEDDGMGDDGGMTDGPIHDFNGHGHNKTAPQTRGEFEHLLADAGASVGGPFADQ